MDVTKRENSFQYCYEELCRIHNCPVLYRVKVYVHMGVLDFYGDGINEHDWRPILQALDMDRNLHFVAIRNKASRQPNPPHHGPKKSSPNANQKAIPRSVLARLPAILRDYLTHNTRLTNLELDGIQLTMDGLVVLSNGLSKSTSLKCISVRRCLVGDRGCQIICTALRNHRSIISVDFSACDITETGAICVSQLLQYQNLNRYHENWRQSLRYRTPNAEVIPGLLRITLSYNMISDEGALRIIQVLHDDRWLKAIDLQNCNLTDQCAHHILKLFEINDTISILDARNNKRMSQSKIKEIILRLTSRQSQFEWNSNDPSCLPRTASQTAVSLAGQRKSNRLCKTTSSIFPTGNTSVHEPRMKHLEQLKEQLEEEIAKRKEAEANRDQAQSRLESHLKELAATQAAISGRVLVDKDVIQQVNSAFSDVNQLLDMVQGARVGPFSHLSDKSPFQESSNTGTTCSSEIKCYNDDPTSTDTSYAKTNGSMDVRVNFSSMNLGQGDCFQSFDEADDLTNTVKGVNRDEAISSVQNSCTEEELFRTNQSHSDASASSWTTVASLPKSIATSNTGTFKYRYPE